MRRGDKVFIGTRPPVMTYPEHQSDCWVASAEKTLLAFELRQIRANSDQKNVIPLGRDRPGQPEGRWRDFKGGIRVGRISACA